jgi:hypothetical protein
MHMETGGWVWPWSTHALLERTEGWHKTPWSTYTDYFIQVLELPKGDAGLASQATALDESESAIVIKPRKLLVGQQQRLRTYYSRPDGFGV